MKADPKKLRLVAVTLAVAALGLAGPVEAQAVSARADGASKAAAIDYATWQNDVRKVIDQARPGIEQRIANGGGQKQAIVLDIDNTSLETHFQLFPPTPAVKPVLDLAKYAHDRGVGIFFITARPDLLDQVTRGNLVHVGYPITGLYQRPIGDVFDSPAAFKTAKRIQIESDGYTIIANIGNSATDFAGGHAERDVKLPDYDGQLS
ncbi:HAD family acid phosphatase [Streptomyces sp. 796.1]|uniref:HAD family acid phosphatase n=1 Tax=Streptomyces sp. 796.1 TaxID=3163029 RepID=UPI0039C91C2D